MWYRLTLAANDEPGTQEAADAAAQDAPGQLDTGTQSLWESVDSMRDSFISLLPQIAIGLVVFVVFCLLSNLARVVIRDILNRRNKTNLGQVLGRLAQWALILAGLMVASTIIAPSVKPVDLLAGLGIGGVAIGFAFKDILQNFLAGVLILLREPFQIGDQIKSGSFEGTVEAIETRATLIRTYDGKKVVIPNSQIYTNPVVVMTAYGKRRSEYDVNVDAEMDLAHAFQSMSEAIRQVDGVFRDPPPEVLLSDLDESSVTLRCRWWTAPDQASITRVKDAVVAQLHEVRERLDTAAPQAEETASTENAEMATHA